MSQATSQANNSIQKNKDIKNGGEPKISAVKGVADILVFDQNSKGEFNWHACISLMCIDAYIYKID